jgi:hypothetical protein
MESIDFDEVRKPQIPIEFPPNAEKFPFDTIVFLNLNCQWHKPKDGNTLG